MSSVERSIVRILGADGHPVGGGCLVACGYVATCAHVVRDALNIKKGAEPRSAPSAKISVDFPFLGTSEPVLADIAYWRFFPVDGEPAGFRDLAILRLVQAPPNAVTAALMLSVPTADERFRAYGFERPEGHWVYGDVKHPRDDGWIQLSGDDLIRYFVEKGFSGVPAVLDEKDRYGLEPVSKVFGLIAVKEPRPGLKEAFAIPAHFVQAALDICARQDPNDHIALLRGAIGDLKGRIEERGNVLNEPRFKDRFSDYLDRLATSLDRYEVRPGPSTVKRLVSQFARGVALEREFRAGDELEASEVQRRRSLVAGLSFDGLLKLLHGLAPETAAGAQTSEDTIKITNDWQDDEEQKARIAELLKEIDRVEEGIASAGMDPDDEDRLLTALDILRDELQSPEIDPLVLARTQLGIEETKSALDLFRRLLTLQELFLGRHAAVGMLPPGSIFRDIEFGPSMVVIPAGFYIMGSPEDEKLRFNNEGPQHHVSIKRCFALGRYPLTSEEFGRFCADQPGREPPYDLELGCGRHPVINVSCEDAEAYLAWLTERCGCPYRLPSEAEWEYACRAGTTTRYSFGDQIDYWLANYSQDVDMPTEVGSYASNAFGLYDMHGNVEEWSADTWHKSYEGAPIDGSAWLEGGDASRAVMRGGCWEYEPEHCRSAFRTFRARNFGDRTGGFRAARTLG